MKCHGWIDSPRTPDKIRDISSQQYAVFTFVLYFVTHGTFTRAVVTSIQKVSPLYSCGYLSSDRINDMSQVVDNQWWEDEKPDFLTVHFCLSWLRLEWDTIQRSWHIECPLVTWSSPASWPIGSHNLTYPVFPPHWPAQGCYTNMQHSHVLPCFCPCCPSLSSLSTKLQHQLSAILPCHPPSLWERIIRASFSCSSWVVWQPCSLRWFLRLYSHVTWSIFLLEHQNTLCSNCLFIPLTPSERHRAPHPPSDT